MQNDHDKTVLDRYKHAVETRLRILEGQGLVSERLVANIEQFFAHILGYGHQ